LWCLNWSPLIAIHRILAFRPGALGDTILTADALIALRSHFSDAEIELIGNAQAGAVLVQSEIVQRVTTFDSAEVTALYTRPPRLAPRWATADVAVLWLGRADPIAGVLCEAGVGRVIIGEPPTTESHLHAADQLMASLAPLGITQRPQLRPLVIGHDEHEAAPRAATRSALIHPGSGAARKNWPSDRYAALARQLVEDGWSVSLLSGPADESSVRQVVASLGNTAPRVVAPASVVELAKELTNTALYIGNDSGVTHLSARLGTPTVAIFGPTDPRQWAPRGPRVAVLRGAPWPSVDAVLRELGRPFWSGEAQPAPA
jgi:ADP-heptose:LPS heptosyltransferase